MSVITPSDVDTIAIPKPFNTLGTSPVLAYTRKPGFEIRFNPVITRSLFFPYFKNTFMTPCLPSSSTVKSLINPSDFKMLAIATFIFDDGTSKDS